MGRSRTIPLEQLLARFLAEADEEAMEELVRRTRPRLLATAARIAGSTAAEDAVQTAYHSLVRKKEVPRDAPLMAWLLTAVVRTAYRHRAKQAREDEVARRLTQEARPAEGNNEEIALLRREVERLPAAYRDVVVLHYLEGLTAVEVGNLVGISQAAVWQRLHRARSLLRSRLSPRMKSGLLAVPWWLADGAVAAVKSKAVVFTAIAVLVSLGIGITWRSSRGEEARERVDDSGHGATALAESARRSTGEPDPPRAEPEVGEHQPISDSGRLADPSMTALRIRVFDDRQVPVRDARVWLVKLERTGPKDAIERRTDAAGVVEFSGHVAGQWFFSARARGIQRSRQVELVRGRRVECTVEISRTGARLDGRVTDPEGEALAGLSVRLDAPGEPYTTRLSASTDEDGLYRIPIVPPGTYRVRVEGEPLEGQPRQF
ncbi:MAG: sigma-70 family RNA polymerase sigma factor, partial [Planctomycetota bacterium]